MRSLRRSLAIVLVALLSVPAGRAADPALPWGSDLQKGLEAARKSGKHGNILRLLFGPPLSFVRTFVVRAGFLDGWRGVLIAAAGARYVFLREFRILR